MDPFENTQAVRIPVAMQLRMLDGTVPVEMRTIEMPPLSFPDESDAVPAPAPEDPTAKNRDPIATLLGVAPLAPMKVLAAPALIPTENVERLPAVIVERQIPMLAAPRPAESARWIATLRRVPRWCLAATVAATLLVTVAAVI